MIAEFYEDREIFFTGGSGVVGKSAIEKLLRSCNVRKIYILVRNKFGVSSTERLAEIKKSRIFRVLKEQKPNELDKLVVIPGDTQLDRLGISNEHIGMLKNVSVFFHSAATTRFDEPLRAAIRLNVKSTLEALKLAETLENLKIFIHVSTFFSNPFLKFIDSKVEPPVFDWRIAMKMLDEPDTIDPILEGITYKAIQGFPNTYLFTKHLSEQVVNEYRSKLPVGIYRPSIIINAMREPEVGFTETMIGIMGVMVVIGTGILRVIFARPDIRLDMAPLDITTKILLIFTARTAKLSRERIQAATPVSMFSSYGLVEPTFANQTKYLSAVASTYPFVKAVWPPGVKLTQCRFIYNFYHFMLQLLPAFLIDGLLKLFRQKPFLMKIQRKIKVTTGALDFFMNTEYGCAGIPQLDEMLAETRGTDFDFEYLKSCADSGEHMWITCRTIINGCRKFLLNEDDSQLPLARKLLRWKKITYNTLRVLIVYSVGKKMYQMATHYMEQ